MNIMLQHVFLKKVRNDTSHSVSDSWDTKKDFNDIVGRLAVPCLDIHEHVMALSLSDVEETYSEWLQWTGCPSVSVISVSVPLYLKLLKKCKIKPIFQ